MKLRKIKVISCVWLFSWITTIFSAITITFGMLYIRFGYDYNDIVAYAATPCQNFNIITSLHFENMKIYDILFISLISAAIFMHLLIVIFLTNSIFGKKQQTHSKQKYIRESSSVKKLQTQDKSNNVLAKTQQPKQLFNVSQSYSQSNFPKYIIELGAFSSFVVLMTALGHEIRIYVQILRSTSCMNEKMIQYKNKMYPEIIVLILSCLFCTLQILFLFLHHLNKRNGSNQNTYSFKLREKKSKLSTKSDLKYKADQIMELAEGGSIQNLQSYNEILPSQTKFKNSQNLEMIAQVQNLQQNNSQKSQRFELIALQEIEITLPKQVSEQKLNMQQQQQKELNIQQQKKKQLNIQQQQQRQLNIQQQQKDSQIKNYRLFELDMKEQSYLQYHTINDQNSNSSPDKNSNSSPDRNTSFSKSSVNRRKIFSKSFHEND